MTGDGRHVLSCDDGHDGSRPVMTDQDVHHPRISMFVYWQTLAGVSIPVPQFHDPSLGSGGIAPCHGGDAVDGW